MEGSPSSSSSSFPSATVHRPLEIQVKPPPPPAPLVWFGWMVVAVCVRVVVAPFLAMANCERAVCVAAASFIRYTSGCIKVLLLVVSTGRPPLRSVSGFDARCVHIQALSEFLLGYWTERRWIVVIAKRVAARQLS